MCYNSFGDFMRLDKLLANLKYGSRNDIKKLEDSKQAIYDDHAKYVEEHQNKLSAWNIDCDCTQWHIDCVKMVLDRIEMKLCVEEYKNKNS